MQIKSCYIERIDELNWKGFLDGNLICDFQYRKNAVDGTSIMNDAFGSGTDSWSGSSATVAAVSGQLEVTLTGTGGGAYKGATVDSNKIYHASIDIDPNGNPEYVIVQLLQQNPSSATPIAADTIKDGSVKTITFEFCAPTDSLVFNGTSTEVFYMDNAIIQEQVFTPEVLNYSDFFLFGMVQPGRQFNGSAYRFGMMGKEKDDEIKGENNSLDFGARIYDPRVGRWLSLDPLAKKYPSVSPFNFVANNPILLIDPDGQKIKIHYTDANGRARTVKLKKVDDLKVYANHENNFVRMTVGALSKAHGHWPGGPVQQAIELRGKRGTVHINFTEPYENEAGRERVENNFDGKGRINFNPEFSARVFGRKTNSLLENILKAHENTNDPDRRKALAKEFGNVSDNAEDSYTRGPDDVLVGELGHFLMWNKSPEKQLQLKKTPRGGGMENAEEERNINETENVYTKKKGDNFVRTSHIGDPVRTKEESITRGGKNK